MINDIIEHQVKVKISELNFKDTTIFIHEGMCSPTASKIVKPIESRNLSTFPAMNKEAIFKQFSDPEATALGHREQIYMYNKKIKQGVISKKKGEWTNYVFVMTIEVPTPTN